MAIATKLQIPGYVAGTWSVDPVHSDVSFTVRHMMVSKVRGHFRTFSGKIVTAADPLDSSVEASVEVGSIDTNSEQRDAHIRSGDFFDAEKNPEMTYRSTGVRADGDNLLLDGELTLRGITKPVALNLEANGFGPDPYGGTRAGFTARGRINRRDFGVSFGAVADGFAVVSDDVELLLEIEAVLDQAA